MFNCQSFEDGLKQTHDNIDDITEFDSHLEFPNLHSKICSVGILYTIINKKKVSNRVINAFSLIKCNAFFLIKYNKKTCNKS